MTSIEECDAHLFLLSVISATCITHTLRNRHPFLPWYSPRWWCTSPRTPFVAPSALPPPSATSTSTSTATSSGGFAGCASVAAPFARLFRQCAVRRRSRTTCYQWRVMLRREGWLSRVSSCHSQTIGR